MPAISRLLALGLSLTVFVGCEQKGPVQKAGEKVDKAVEETGKAIEKAGEKVKDATK